jgi:glycerophosphoryl diester phosphodiesterase
LLIDIKSDGEATYRALSKVLAGYAGILTRVQDGKRVPGAVTAIVSGNRPRTTMEAEDPRYAFYDGRLTDLESDISADFMPLVSDNWSRTFGWRGDGEMPANERQLLDDLVAGAHGAGYKLRFWDTPDRPGAARYAVWNTLVEAGVDFINTDDLQGLADFLTKQ